MEYEIKNDILKQKKEFPCASDRLKTIVDPYDYCNIIAKNIGVDINMFSLLFTNPSLYYMILFDSWNHHVYRLNDKHIEKQKIAIENIQNNHTAKITIKFKWIMYQLIYYHIFVYIFYCLLVLSIILCIYYYYYYYDDYLKPFFRSIRKKYKK
jgi:hypothetical protein